MSETTLRGRTGRYGPYAPRERTRDAISPESRKIIDQLTQARRDAGMTQLEVARAIGGHDGCISEIETGKREASLALVAQYARVVDLPWIEVF